MLQSPVRAVLPAALLIPVLFCFHSMSGAFGPNPALDRDQILKTKVDRLLPGLMRDNGLDCWLVFTRENARDPMADDLGGSSVVGRSAFVFCLDKSAASRGIACTAIVASLDADEPDRSGIYDRVIQYKEEGIKPHLRAVIRQANPQRIALDYSRDEPIADGLTAGMRDYLADALGEEYAKRFVSAEDLLISFRSRKLPEEIETYRRAVEMTQQIVLSALSSRTIRPGRTSEADITRFLDERTRQLGAEVAFSSVRVGSGTGNLSPLESFVRAGDLIRIDFGISWQGYKTDIQRTAYVLRQGEEGPGDLINKMWSAAVKANRAAVAAMKPGATGAAVDAAARKSVLSSGFAAYQHATGHPVGVAVHDAGSLLAPDWRERYGPKVLRKLEETQLYAVEPTVTAHDDATKSDISIGLEEAVVIEADGARYLGIPQAELILIR